jgi:hypothetical protein
MNVIGHEDIGPQIEALVLPRDFDRFGKPPASSIRLEKLEFVKTTKGEYVGVAHDVEVSTMSTRHSHDIKWGAWGNAPVTQSLVQGGISWGAAPATLWLNERY